MPSPKPKDTDPPRKRVTLQTLADACGLSVGAVSQCLRDPEHPRFSEVTRKKVAEYARRFNYVPNQLAANLRKGCTHSLSMVVPWNTPEMLDSAELEAKKLGYTLSIHFTGSPDLEAERKAIAHAVGHRSDGILWMPSNAAWGYRRTIQRLRQSGTETIFLEIALPTMPEAGVVEIDYATPLRFVLQGLLERGSTDFLLLNDDPNNKLRKDRAEVFTNFCGEAGVAGSVVEVNSKNQLTPLLLDRAHGAAILCESDWLAIDILRTAEAEGLSFTETLNLVSIGDMLIGGRYRIGEIAQPAFSSIRRPSGDLARRAIAALVERIENRNSVDPARIKLAAEFIPRATTPAGL